MYGVGVLNPTGFIGTKLTTSAAPSAVQTIAVGAIYAVRASVDSYWVSKAGEDPAFEGDPSLNFRLEGGTTYLFDLKKDTRFIVRTVTGAGELYWHGLSE